MDGSEEIQAFAYERKGNSAVIRRCFSRDTKAAVPGMIDGLPVTELAPYAFSAHMDQQLLEQELVAGRLQLGRSMLVPEEDEVLTSHQRYQRLRQAQIPALCGEQLEELELAYAITIHKSQGSEYPAVVIPVWSGPQMLMTRNLIYTAVTRARACVCLVGVPYVFQQMVDNAMEQKRYSGLRDRIEEIMETL